jgi:pimeloyl-ACP methyl ester carboxylesterase
MTASGPTVVLVHGAWHTSQCWSAVRRRLDLMGVRSTTVDLPSSGTDPARLGDLHADVAEVRRALAAVDGTVVLCGHSYGGVVITEAGAGLPNVRHLVYLAAFMPAEQQSVLDCCGPGGPPPYVEIRADGSSTVPPDLRIDTFYGDLPATEAQLWADRLLLHSAAAVSTPVSAAAWRDMPSTYVVTTEDHSIPPGLQRRMAAQADVQLELHSGHSPFLSQPQLVAGLLAGLASDLLAA